MFEYIEQMQTPKHTLHTTILSTHTCMYTNTPVMSFSDTKSDVCRIPYD